MPADESCRIVVTGIGLCTPFGPDRESSWQGILRGVGAPIWLKAPHWPDDSLTAGAPCCYSSNRPFKHDEPLVELALTTATEALADARLNSLDLNRNVVGVVYGTSKGGLHSFTKLMQHARTDRRLDRLHSSSPDSGIWLDVLPDRAATAIRQHIGGYGPVLCPVLACATGLAACLRGADLIRNGDCNIVLAGSADASLQPAILASFRRLGVLSRELTEPAKACRPYDVNRSGFVIGEGAACLVLERLDAALARRANIYAEWLGGAMLSDSFSLTQLDPSGTSLKRLMQVLRHRSKSDPDYINLHGTGTVTNDLVECHAIREVFGPTADGINCSSLKGGLGHLLGAAGSVELAATVLAIRDQNVPPTANLFEQDPECRLNLTARRANPRTIDRAWKLSMGFGGHLAGACLGRVIH